MRKFSYAGGFLPLGKKTYIMGILNVTPDSFYDGGRYFAPERAVKTAVELQKAGADIIDIGAVSTRPGADRADGEEELRRIKSVFKEIRSSVDVPISVDTYRPAVARYCLQNGANIINDVSGGISKELADEVSRYGAGWIIMHAGEKGAKTEDVIDYPHSTAVHVRRFFDGALEKTGSFGISRENVCLDPGFGFAKTNEQNVELLKSFELLQTDGCALLCALSRKRFIGALFNETAPEDRLAGTLAANTAAVLKGADIIRVHDVKEHKELISGLDAIAR